MGFGLLLLLLLLLLLFLLLLLLILLLAAFFVFLILFFHGESPPTAVIIAGTCDFYSRKCIKMHDAVKIHKKTCANCAYIRIFKFYNILLEKKVILL